MSMIYFEDESDLSLLSQQTVGVIGYGELAQALALNMRDSGVHVLVSAHSPDESDAAESHQLPLASASVVAQRAHILVLALPDETLPQVYMESISPHLARGYTLVFTSAYTVTFGFIEPPPFVDVGLVSPRATGISTRANYLSGAGTSSVVAVGQDASRAAWGTVLAVAGACGALRAGAVEVNFEQEAQLTLFVQQALIPVFHHLMVTAADVLMRSGFSAEAALPDLYLSGKFQAYLAQTAQTGLLNAIQASTQTGQYATLSRLSRFNDLKLERLLEVTLDEIRAGDFAREWAREYADGGQRLNKLNKAQAALDLWEWEQQTLELLARRF
ncbi:MAG: NAD(P)-binding domain-containing protein [Armatimonadetes bacterium]|nr:NAD(P)-binding domain-containing protein [Anaerolineae bacterium]